MIAKDQPTIFDTSKVVAILSSKEDGNTRPEWSSVKGTISSIKIIARMIGADADKIVAMDVAAKMDVWDEIVDLTSGEGMGVKDPKQRIAADALVTSLPELFLLLPVADCNAVAIHDPVHNVIALVHLGWKSTVAGLATKVIQHLQQKYGSSATELRIYFSPAIQAKSYIFDKVSQADDPRWRPFLHKTGHGFGVDLPGYNRQRFIDAGVLQNIETSPIDTATSDEYYSHYRSVRADESEGRFALLVGLKG